VVVPGELWRESGRWETMGAGMLRMKNRVDQELVVSPTAEEAFSKLLPRIHDGAIVLLHSTSQTNAEILDDLLTRWKNMGYTFAALTDLP